MVESYYPNMIPIFCFNDENNPYPNLFLTVKRRGQGDLLLSYTDVGITPILIPKKELVNALFRTNGHEKNSILMAVNKEINVCTTHKKELYN